MFVLSLCLAEMSRMVGLLTRPVLSQHVLESVCVCVCVCALIFVLGCLCNLVYVCVLLSFVYVLVCVCSGISSDGIYHKGR